VKLIFQIPCLNEAEVLSETIAGLPHRVQGFDVVEVMVIDDGSSDETVAIAGSLGVDHIARMNGHQGLGRTFMAGLAAAVVRGASVIVNHDADSRYHAACIQALLQPILDGRADIVIGARPMDATSGFSPGKRLLQILGSWVVSRLAGVEVSDATSGFRAMSREAALRLNVFGRFTYTIETILQAGLSGLRIVNVPIEYTSVGRPSRLFRSNGYYIGQSLRTMASAYLIYRPTRVFGLLSLLLFALGAGVCLWFRSGMHAGEGGSLLPALAGCGFLLAGLCAALLALVAYLQQINRQFLEEVRWLLRSQRLDGRKRLDPQPYNSRPNRLASFQEFEPS
jgi:glycosyltransferase involved in cell wall biosynthesis